jgi:hypothetical protein
VAAQRGHPLVALPVADRPVVGVRHAAR